MTKNRLEELWRRWGVTVSDTALFTQFKARFSVIYRAAIRASEFDADVIKRLLFLIRGDGLFNASLREPFDSAPNMEEFVIRLQQVFWVLEDYPEDAVRVYRVLKEALDLSPGVDLEIVRRGNKYTLYAAGAKELDAALVDQPLEWLDRYPVVAELFEESLRIILSREASRYKHAVDNLRKAVEELLKILFDNKKSIEKQKPALLTWLASHGVHKESVNMYADWLSRFALFQNDAVKHGSWNWTAEELEYVVYQTGVFIRLMLRLEQRAS